MNSNKIIEYTNYKRYVDELLNSNGKLSHVYIPIPLSVNVKDLQRAIHKYAGHDVVKTYQNTNHELVVQRKQGITFPNINFNSTKQNRGFIAQEVKIPHIFKVGDKGKTVSGESYEVVEKATTLRVKITDKSGRVRNAIRKETGEVVNGFNYNNQQSYSLLPPTETRTIYLNIYNKSTIAHETLEAANFNADPSALAVGIPVVVEFTHLY